MIPVDEEERKKYSTHFSLGIDYIALQSTVKSKFLPTKVQPPPNSLYEWARERLLTPGTSFTRPGKFYNFVKESLEGLRDEISISTDISPFWDIQFSGNKTKSLSVNKIYFCYGFC